MTKTSKKSFSTAIVGDAALEYALRHLRSVRFNYDEGDTRFTFTAHPHEYQSAMTALNLAQKAHEADLLLRRASTQHKGE